MAAQQPPRRKAYAAKQAVSFNGFRRVARTTGLETAMSAQIRGNAKLIRAYQPDCGGF